MVLARDNSTRDNSTPPLPLPPPSVDNKAADPSTLQKVNKPRQPAQQPFDAGTAAMQASSRKRRSASPAVTSVSEQVWVLCQLLVCLSMLLQQLLQQLCLFKLQICSGKGNKQAIP